MGKERNVYINELSMLLGEGANKVSCTASVCAQDIWWNMNIDDFRNMDNKSSCCTLRVIIENQFVWKLTPMVVQKMRSHRR
jgi:hypothetical protein